MVYLKKLIISEFMNKEIEKILEELNCITYKYDKDNSVLTNYFISNDVHVMYKELVIITSELESLNIKFEIDIDNNILLLN